MHRGSSIAASLAVVWCAAAAAAQARTIVSPLANATTEGNSSTTMPWVVHPAFQPGRWLAIHGDLTGTPRIFSGIAHRRDGPAGPQPGTRVVDVEIAMGDAVPYDLPSWLFANNWTSAPTLVLPRQLVNLGPFAAAGQPAPFELRFAFATPFVYLGLGSLAYEVRVFGNNAAGLTNALDAVGTNGVAGFPGLPQGTGCTVIGQGGPMTLTLSHGAIGTTYTFGAVLRDAPPNAPAVLAFGLANPNLSVPGLCNNVMTDFVATLGLGLTDAAGMIAETLSAGGTTLYLPAGQGCLSVVNGFANGQFYVQAHALDPSSAWSIPAASSNGLQVFVPPVGPAVPSKVTSLFTLNPSPTHPSAMFMTSAIGFGLVTEFRW